jgi:Na+-driven multidrug efflux pump
MNRVAAVLRGFGATLVSAVISIIGFVLLGGFLPVWAMMLIYGRQNVQDAPGHGGVILLATLPIAGVLALFCFFILTPLVYRRLSRHR